MKVTMKIHPGDGGGGVAISDRTHRYIACIGADWGSDAADAVGQIATKIHSKAGDPLFLQRTLGHYRPYEIRYIFFLNWSQMVPKIVTDRWECINFHSSRLPFGRGGGPIENLIKLGYTETVITAHRMVEEVDAGPIYCRSDQFGMGRDGEVSLAGTKPEILARFVEPVATMMKWIIENEPPTRPQDGEPMYFKRLPKDEYEALWEERG